MRPEAEEDGAFETGPFGGVKAQETEKGLRDGYHDGEATLPEANVDPDVRGNLNPALADVPERDKIEPLPIPRNSVQAMSQPMDHDPAGIRFGQGTQPRAQIDGLRLARKRHLPVRHNDIVARSEILDPVRTNPPAVQHKHGVTARDRDLSPSDELDFVEASVQPMAMDHRGLPEAHLERRVIIGDDLAVLDGGGGTVGR